jgi:hypothetical protein
MSDAVLHGPIRSGTISTGLATGDDFDARLADPISAA